MVTFVIPSPKSQLVDKETGLVSREWFIYFSELLSAIGTGNVGTTTQVLHGGGLGYAQVVLSKDVTGILAGINGGTGVANGLKSITLGGDLTTSGAFSVTINLVGSTDITFPISGTLATTSQIGTIASQDANNVSITGGTVSNVTINALSVSTASLITDTFSTVSTVSFGGAIQPATPASVVQSATQLWAGTGAPSNGDGQNGDYYFRSDGTTSVTHIYFKSAGAWVGRM